MNGTSFYSVKGGAGCSTVAACFALLTAETEQSTRVRSRQPEDMASIFGVPEPASPGSSVDIGAGNGALWLEPWTWPDPTDVPTIYDYGLDIDGLPDARTFLVIQPEYLSLKRALKIGHSPDGVVLMGMPERSLQQADVEDVLGLRVVATVPWEPVVATAIDAGILTRRLPANVRKGLRPLLTSVNLRKLGQ